MWLINWAEAKREDNEDMQGWSQPIDLDLDGKAAETVNNTDPFEGRDHKLNFYFGVIRYPQGYSMIVIQMNETTHTCKVEHSTPDHCAERDTTNGGVARPIGEQGNTYYKPV